VLETVLEGDDRRGAGLVAALGQSRGIARVTEGEDETVRSSADARLEALFETLVPADVWPLLRDASEVLVVPDGALHRVPFEGLVVGRAPDGRPRYWLDDGPVVRYSPSVTTAYNLGRSGADRGASSSSSAVVVANPAFERPGSRASFPPPVLSSTRQWAGALASLPGTAREAALIRAAILPSGAEVLVLAEDAAEEAAVRAALGSQPRRFVHFATHGLVDESRSELLAALALTPPQRGTRTPDNDGLLQLFEIYDLDARSELTVLSACDSHSGRNVDGEGVFALSRAFLGAGSRRVVASLWPVDDASTAVLMGAFYGRIAAGAGDGPDYARALRDARREVRERREWSSPYFWAPFILTGAR
jgi:CHAT domain-containing protein